jgi:hypothetical protein
MLDMARGVTPPDHRDNSANQEQQKQKSQRIEPVRLSIPTMPVADHSIHTLSIRQYWCGDTLEDEQPPEGWQGLLGNCSDLSLSASFGSLFDTRAVFGQLALKCRESLFSSSA